MTSRAGTHLAPVEGMETAQTRGTIGAGRDRWIARIVGRRARGAFVWWSLVLICARVVNAGETRFGADATQDLGELARTGRLAISVERTNDLYRIDASAVLRVDARRLLGASIDYERYQQFGVPNLRASHVVSGAPSKDLLYTWSWVSYLGYASKHYLAVQVVRNLQVSGATGICWELVSRQPAWTYEDASAFTRLDGSWYIEPLAEDVVYVRYYLVAALDQSVPEGLRAWAVKRQLREGTRGVVEALAHQAEQRP
jgi:ribosome-associated toxin RatA of RatAB toxin-antitoxin module